MAAMANVLALDISYDEGIKFLAGQIFLMSLFVLAPFAIRFFSAFDLTRDVHAAPARRLFQSESVDRTARAVGVVLGVWIAWTTLQDSRNKIARYNQARQGNAILGIWDVEAMTKNGTPVPLLITDATLWRRLVAHSNNAAVIVPMTQSAPQSQWTGRSTTVKCNVRLDSASQTVQFTPFPFLGAVGPVAFAYALPDPDHLVLTSRNQNETTVVVRLRRFDLSAYPLLNWERHWSW